MSSTGSTLTALLDIVFGPASSPPSEPSEHGLRLRPAKVVIDMDASKDDLMEQLQSLEDLVEEASSCPEE